MYWKKVRNSTRSFTDLKKMGTGGIVFIMPNKQYNHIKIFDS